VLQECQWDAEGRPAYLRWGGPALLAAGGVPLPGQGRDAHAHGFGAAVGPLADGSSTAELDAERLRRRGFAADGRGRLDFASGVVLEGRLAGIRERDGGALLLTFDDCRVSWGDRLLFDPAWGCYDLACGREIAGVCGGWVDRLVDPEDLPDARPAMKCNLDEGNRELAPLYQELRRIREAGERGPAAQRRLAEIAGRLERDFPDDWLLPLELVELAERLPAGLEESLRRRLADFAARGPEQEELVDRGLALLE
jgi:phenylalanine-4-hydroxylase